MEAHTASFIDRRALLLKVWLEDEEKSGFDKLEVWRATAGQGGPYSELTGDSWDSAYLTVQTGPKAISGKTLELLVGVVPITVTFTGVDPLTASSMAAQIEDQSAGLLRTSSTSNPDTLEVATTGVGCGARLEITGGDAAIIIGFSTLHPTNTAYGTDARLSLLQQNAYTFEDPWGQEGYYYKTRLRRMLDGVTGEFSVPITGNPTRAVTPDKLIRGYVRVVDFQGRPVANRSVLISTKNTVHNSVSGGLLVDMADQTIYTDKSGYASLLLLRGVEVTVGVAGTALVRDVTAPTDSTVDTFNMFDPAVGHDDAFRVAVPDINVAEPVQCP
jgi:hypothetical protein